MHGCTAARARSSRRGGDETGRRTCPRALVPSSVPAVRAACGCASRAPQYLSTSTMYSRLAESAAPGRPSMAGSYLQAVACLAFVIVGQLPEGAAALALSQALSSSMVLQRAPARARMWGTDSPGAVVTVAQAKASATVGKNGRWSLLLPPQPAGPAFGTGTIVVTSSGGGNITVSDVLMGETWLCTGQSNMWLPLGVVGAGDKGQEKLVSWSGDVSWGLQELNRTEHYPLVRVTKQDVPTNVTAVNLTCSEYHGRQRCSRDSPADDAMASRWLANKTAANMYGFSAVCWMYGRQLFDYLREQEGVPVPVGLVQIARGGTAVELWSSSRALAQCDQRRAEKMAPCQDPHKSVMYSETTYTNSTLYNSMLHPWILLATRGAIWYQVSTSVWFLALLHMRVGVRA